MSESRLAGSAGPHVFVDSLTAPILADEDAAHLERSLRMRGGDPLTISDGRGSWCEARYSGEGLVEVTGPEMHLPARERPLTVAFALVKGSKPELVIQKLTELGIDRIVVCRAERTVVKWDDHKVAKARSRWERISREASMQSHRVRMPEILGVIDAMTFIADEGAAIAHFGGEPVSALHDAIIVGPEGGWTDAELAAAPTRVSLGSTVLRAETAAISAGVLLTAASA